MTKSYSQLNLEQRYQVEALLKANIKVPSIALIVGVHQCNIYRERNRNSVHTAKQPVYKAANTQLFATKRAFVSKPSANVNKAIFAFAGCSSTANLPFGNKPSHSFWLFYFNHNLRLVMNQK